MNLKTNDILQTPDYIWQPLGPFDLDPCAGEFTEIGKVNWWDGRGENGLEREWNGFVWCNPPFSQKEIWAEKMIKHNNGILILPERGSAPWFGPLAESVGVYFVMGKKINFIGGPSSNNLGSILFPFGSEAVNRIEKSELPGHLVNVRWFKPRRPIVEKPEGIFNNEPSVAEVVEIEAMKPSKALTLNNGKMFKLYTSATILSTLC